MSLWCSWPKCGTHQFFVILIPLPPKKGIKEFNSLCVACLLCIVCVTSIGHCKHLKSIFSSSPPPKIFHRMSHPCNNPASVFLLAHDLFLPILSSLYTCFSGCYYNFQFQYSPIHFKE
ncbi:unnamed protein product [Pipistrellus nathusii]|uniref:Uncharacterized protein n=1 Tax=Pipistrellus nathusii TaxID=59473 RepID=A0ABN9ZK87_PIPNA